MTREKALETIIVLALAALIASFWLDVGWLIYVAIGFLVVSLFSGSLTFWIARGWFAFSHYLGIVMNYMLMFAIYHLILIPLAFFQRITGNRHIGRKANSNSHFHFKGHHYTEKDITRPW